jgi:hypothetical protein
VSIFSQVPSLFDSAIDCLISQTICTTLWHPDRSGCLVDLVWTIQTTPDSEAGVTSWPSPSSKDSDISNLAAAWGGDGSGIGSIGSTGLILGLVFGLLFLLAIVVAFFIIFVFRRRSRSESERNESGFEFSPDLDIIDDVVDCSDGSDAFSGDDLPDSWALSFAQTSDDPEFRGIE